MSSMKTMYIMTELRVNDDIFTTKPEYQHQVFNGTPTDDHFITWDVKPAIHLNYKIYPPFLDNIFILNKVQWWSQMKKVTKHITFSSTHSFDFQNILLTHCKFSRVRSKYFTFTEIWAPNEKNGSTFSEQHIFLSKMSIIKLSDIITNIFFNFIQAY